MSDELMEDLEYQLGSTLTEYLQVRVAYRHSGFPQHPTATLGRGVAGVCTTMETCATAIIKRHNSSSPWSPRPAPQPNPLFEIIASHWGPAAANDVMQRILASRSNPRKPAHLYWKPKVRHNATSTDAGNAGSGETVKPAPPTRVAPPVPRRQASLQRPLAAETPSSGEIENPDRDSDPARKIWTEMRRTSTGGRPSWHVSRVRRVPSAAQIVQAPVASSTNKRAKSPRPPSSPTTPTRSSGKDRSKGRLRDEILRQREAIQTQALRNQRSVGADTLRSLVPTVAEMSLDGKDAEGSVAKGERGERLRLGNVGGVLWDGGGAIRGKKEAGRWGWNGWW